MAEILIKGIQFPKFSPHVIEVYPDGTAIVHGKGIYGKAVPVPSHGDLIDKDETMNEILEERGEDNACWFAGIVNDMPTVIPADKDGRT